jgi:hypothetical protein
VIGLSESEIMGLRLSPSRRHLAFSPKAIEEQFRGLDEGITRKMLWENVHRVYRIGEQRPATSPI